MQVAQLMTDGVKTCRQTDTLDVAARLMWVHDIGAVPVVDQLGQLVGIVTDRDACLAAYLQSQPLHAVPCATAMSKHVISCRADDDAATVAKIMAKHQIRRVPVVDDAQKPIGMLSLSDFALAMAHGLGVAPGQVAGTLAAIGEHRPLASTTRTPTPYRTTV